jgi:hypothetical protein
MVENGKVLPAEATKLKAEPIELNYRKMDENTGMHLISAKYCGRT